MIARNSTDIEMMDEFRNDLESTLRESIKNSKFQSNVEYMSSVSIVLVNLNREKSNEKMLHALELSATEITDPVQGSDSPKICLVLVPYFSAF